MSLLHRLPVARLRLTLVRHPSIHWVAVAVVAAAVGAGVHQRTESAERTRASWGETVEVSVATHIHRVGDPIRAERRDLPVAVTPPGAVAEIDPGARAVRPIGVGEILVETDLTDRTGPGALADPGSAVVAVADPLVPEPPIGVEVAVAAEGIVLAERGRVVDRRAEVALVAVPIGDAPAVAAAARQGVASLVFRSPDPP